MSENKEERDNSKTKSFYRFLKLIPFGAGVVLFIYMLTIETRWNLPAGLLVGLSALVASFLALGSTSLDLFDIKDKLSEQKEKMNSIERKIDKINDKIEKKEQKS